MRKKPFIRVCALCGSANHKQEMIKFKKAGGKVVFADENTGGKSIYLCKNCAKTLENPKNINKAFRMNVDGENAKQILEKLKEN